MHAARDAGLIHETHTRSIIGAFYEVYNELGYGFLESVYVAAMTQLLTERGHKVARDVAVPVYFRGKLIARRRLDMLVDDRIVLETRSTAILPKSAERQLRSYLNATHLEVGLLLHFGPEAKFYRIISTNSGHRDQKNESAISAESARSPYPPTAGNSDHADSADIADQSTAGNGDDADSADIAVNSD